jgi:hypothetical protein
MKIKHVVFLLVVFAFVPIFIRMRFTASTRANTDSWGASR